MRLACFLNPQRTSLAQRGVAAAAVLALRCAQLKIGAHTTALRQHNFTAGAQLCRLTAGVSCRGYAAATTGSGSGSGGGAHGHSAGEAKSSGGGASSGGATHATANASGAAHGGNAASGGGGSSGGSGRQRKGSTTKKLKMKTKKTKASRRTKRKLAVAKPAATKAQSTMTPAAATPSGAAANHAATSSTAGGAASAAPKAKASTITMTTASGAAAAATTTAAKKTDSARKGKRHSGGTATRGRKSSATTKSSSSTNKSSSRSSSNSGSSKKAGSGGKSGSSSPANTTAAASTSSTASAASKGLSRSKRKHKKLRVCVLSSSYEGSQSATASVDNYRCTPQHYVKKDRLKYTFADVSMKKIDSYRTVRELVTSNKYDVFFNLCDGGRDEQRAGVDVVAALEEHNAAFTGTDSRSFEPSKIDMKLMVGSSGVKVPNFVLLSNEEGLAKKCRHLNFPVIVKHLSGYASVGIHKDNRCDNLDQLKVKVRAFIKEFNHALVEEFIRGREGTVLTCADQNSPFGVKVFKPLMFNFLQSSDDFAYFEKKWTMECNDQAYGFLPPNDPAFHAITEMARNAFKCIMNGVGYGRADFRIDEKTGTPYFLEINPNCGMWYAPKDGGDFADVMVEGDAHWNHERFIASAVTRALKDQAARRPWYFISHDKHGQFSTRASKTVAEGKCLFGDAVHPIPVVAKALYKLGEENPTVGCVICRGDGIHHAVALRHSCEPNMQFVHGRTLLFAAKRSINVGEELTVDFATLRDESMPHFACSCGTEKCRSVIFPMPATPRVVEAKAMKRLLREKRLVWLKEKADREAERLLKKRASPAAVTGSGSGNSGAASAAGGNAGGGGSGGSTASSSGSSGASGSAGGSK